MNAALLKVSVSLRSLFWPRVVVFVFVFSLSTVWMCSFAVIQSIMGMPFAIVMATIDILLRYCHPDRSPGRGCRSIVFAFYQGYSSAFFQGFWVVPLGLYPWVCGLLLGVPSSDRWPYEGFLGYPSEGYDHRGTTNDPAIIIVFLLLLLLAIAVAACAAV